MEITTGTSVYGRKGAKVGEVSHIVLDGRTDEVTHIVVSKGWLLPRDIVVAREDVQEVTEDAVRLRLDEEQLDAQPDFIEAHYAGPEEGRSLPAGYTPQSVLYGPLVPPVGAGWYLPDHTMYTARPEMIETEMNVPEGSVTLSEGMDVWAGDEKAGTLAGVRIHPQSERVSHIVVSQGWLFPEERVLPVVEITAVDERGIHLAPSLNKA